MSAEIMSGVLLSSVPDVQEERRERKWLRQFHGVGYELGELFAMPRNQ